MRDGILIQEEYAPDPTTVDGAWRVVVSTLLCQQTSGTQARPVLDRVFQLWPHMSALAQAGDELEDVLRPSGLFRRRAEQLRAVSSAFTIWSSLQESSHAVPPHDWVAELKGCGDYTVEAYKFVVLGDRSFRPVDKELRKAWNRDRGLVVPGVRSG